MVNVFLSREITLIYESDFKITKMMQRPALYNTPQVRLTYKDVMLGKIEINIVKHRMLIFLLN